MSGGRAVAIRPAEPADVEALLLIENTVFPTDRMERRSFLHAVRSPTIDLLVATRGATVLGYAALHRRRGSRCAHLASIAVRADSSGRGIGRQLLDAAEAQGLKSGCICIRLEVRTDNGSAQRLYDRASYRRLGTIDEYYEDGAAALRYEKGLSPAHPGGSGSEKRSTSRNSSTKRRAP